MSITTSPHMPLSKHQKVKKRDGRMEPISFDKIIWRLQSLSSDLEGVDIIDIVKEVISDIYDGITTASLDDIAARQCANRSSEHPDYDTLAGRIVISSHHKEMDIRGLKSFTQVAQRLYENKDEEGLPCPLLRQDKYEFIMRNAEELNNMIDYEYDFKFSFFGFKTHEKGYFLRDSRTNDILERQQDLLMRCAIQAAWRNNESDDVIMKGIKDVYPIIRDHKTSFATPTQFNACSRYNQNASCFLLPMDDDSIDGIYDTKKNCALISKRAGGIGVSITNLRAKGALIRGTNGRSNGIVGWIKGLEQDALSVNQGGKRNGSFALYNEPWHPDFIDFLRAGNINTEAGMRAFDLFYGIWMPDEFMKRLEKSRKYHSLSLLENRTQEQEDELLELEPYTQWHFICPSKCPDLVETYGEEFEDIYNDCISRGITHSSMPVLRVWDEVLKANSETGTPYMGYKDHANRKSNQKNLGIIYSSNLCIEIIEKNGRDKTAHITFLIYDVDGNKIGEDIIVRPPHMMYEELKEHAEELRKKYEGHSYKRGESTYVVGENHIAVCNLDSIPVNKFIRDDNSYDHDELYRVVRIVTRCLDNIIDDNYYPVEACRRSNMRDRPIGIGIQGLADLFQMLHMVWGSEDALRLDREILETMQFASLSESHALAVERGAYATFANSPLSQGLFQMDLWKEYPPYVDTPLSGRWDWDGLRKNIMKDGVRNSLCIALMPTASTSQILGNSIAFEPRNGNFFVRRTLAGEFQEWNQYLQHDLLRLGIWDDVRDKIMAAPYGTVANISEIPADLRAVYRTAWDVGSKTIIDHAAERAPFVCQSQSMNLFFLVPTTKSLTNAHLYAWRKGLKTGSYYIRQAGQAKAQQFTARRTSETKDTKDTKETKETKSEKYDTTAMEEGAYCKKIDGCVVCSS